jgi:hypothetical protein
MPGPANPLTEKMLPLPTWRAARNLRLFLAIILCFFILPLVLFAIWGENFLSGWDLFLALLRDAPVLVFSLLMLSLHLLAGWVLHSVITRALSNGIAERWIHVVTATTANLIPLGLYITNPQLFFDPLLTTCLFLGMTLYGMRMYLPQDCYRSPFMKELGIRQTFQFLSHLPGVHWLAKLALIIQRSSIGLLVGTIAAYGVAASAFHTTTIGNDLNLGARSDSHRRELYKLTIEKMDYDHSILNVRITTFDRDSLPDPHVITLRYLTWSHIGGGVEAGSEGVRLEMKRIPPEERSHYPELGAHNPSRHAFMAKIRLPFKADLRQFPLDRIRIGFAVDTVTGPDATSTLPGDFWIYNLVPDYRLAEVTQPKPLTHAEEVPAQWIELRRDGFLIFLSCLLLVVALTSSVLLIQRARRSGVEVPLLTYFAGLWAARTILFTPLMEKRPFPTYVDVAILFLYSLTLVGVVVNMWAAKPPPQKSPR